MTDIRLNLLMIRSRNLERAAQFYQAIGLQFEKHRHGNGPEHLACEIADLVFEIYPLGAGQTITSPPRLGFRVPSIEQTMIRLRSLGIRVISEAKPSPWGVRAVVEDFDGHHVEVTQ